MVGPDDAEAPRAKRRRTAGGAETLQVSITPVLLYLDIHKTRRSPTMSQLRMMHTVWSLFLRPFLREFLLLFSADYHPFSWLTMSPFRWQMSRLNPS